VKPNSYRLGTSGDEVTWDFGFASLGSIADLLMEFLDELMKDGNNYPGLSSKRIVYSNDKAIILVHEKCD
jgi:hypothetical protein